jgi:hypothetical protein
MWCKKLNRQFFLPYIQIFFLLLGLVFVNLIFAETKIEIKTYQAVFLSGNDQEGKLKIAIRSYYRDGERYFLVVDPKNFFTSLILAKNFQLEKESKFSNTPYFRALKKYSKQPYVLLNYGIGRADYNTDGVFLTIDMCPAHKPMEREFFQTLVDISKKNHQPIPIAIAMTGLWMVNHPEEFAWLIDQEKQNHLAITWINHSFHHVYHENVPYQQNFLLTPGTNVEDEILSLEKMLLEKGEVPSVFFRFPGLVANQALVMKLNQFGLIPVGSNAWMAKHDPITPGSVILVHGNSNEPQGIKIVLPLLKAGKLRLLSLGELFR